MTSIDTEIATLRARISELEQIKAAAPPVKTLDELRTEMKISLESLKRRPKADPLIHHIVSLSLAVVEATLDSTNKLQERMNTIEEGKIVKEALMSDEDTRLFEALKKKRIELSTTAGVPAYWIATNKALKSFVSLKPKTLVEMKSVFGFGPHKIANYGDDFLSVRV